jgi:hypothetical protein
MREVPTGTKKEKIDMAKVTKITKESVQAIVTKDGYPELESFVDQKHLQKFYKHLTSVQLAEWLDLEGLTESVKPSDSEPIMRMRQCMALLYKAYPREGATKKKSKYGDYTTESLIQLAIENDVVFETCDDERILRMRAIMALRASKVIE